MGRRVIGVVLRILAGFLGGLAGNRKLGRGCVNVLLALDQCIFGNAAIAARGSDGLTQFSGLLRPRFFLFAEFHVFLVGGTLQLALECGCSDFGGFRFVPEALQVPSGLVFLRDAAQHRGQRVDPLFLGREIRHRFRAGSEPRFGRFKVLPAAVAPDAKVAFHDELQAFDGAFADQHAVLRQGALATLHGLCGGRGAHHVPEEPAQVGHGRRVGAFDQFGDGAVFRAPADLLPALHDDLGAVDGTLFRQAAIDLECPPLFVFRYKQRLQVACQVGLDCRLPFLLRDSDDVAHRHRVDAFVPQLAHQGFDVGAERHLPLPDPFE